MKPIGGKRIMASVQVGLSQDLRALFERLQARLSAILLRHADVEGRIPERSKARLRLEIDDAVRAVFVVPQSRAVFAPDGVTALTEYAQLLNQWYAQTVWLVVKAHESWMQQNIPADIYQWLRDTARPLPLSEAERPSQVPDDYPLFHANPLAEIDPARRWVPMHLWQDERGYQLSDRIWRAGEETRRKLDLILTKGLAEGASALQLAQVLEAYLVPNRAGVRTLKPYGARFSADGASYDALRLARTEIARAHNQASYIASYLNPYVDGIDVARSRAGDPSCRICPQHATLDIQGRRVRAPYSKHAAYLPPSHPHCKCRVQPVVSEQPAQVTANLRAIMHSARQDWQSVPVRSAAHAHDFVEQLLGKSLAGLVQVNFQPTLFGS